MDTTSYWRIYARKATLNDVDTRMTTDLCTSAGYLQVVVRRVAFADFGLSLLKAIRQLPALTDLIIDHDGPIIEERTAVSGPE